MKACQLLRPAPIEQNPLVCIDLPDPDPGPGEVRVRVATCGICRTDLHVIEGELEPRRSPVVPGHQIVGRALQALKSKAIRGCGVLMVDE